MLDAIYFPEPLSNKPDWFNGFIEIEKHPKEKYNWKKYVYLPNYYSDNNNCRQIEIQSKYGRIKPRPNNINQFFVDYYSKTKGQSFGFGSKLQIGGETLGNIKTLNAATGKTESHRMLYANNDYIIRQLNYLDKPKLKDLLQVASKEIGIFFRQQIFFQIVSDGYAIAPVNKDGEIHGIQTYTFYKGEISCEPLTYIDSSGRGQGIFDIYHDAALCLGNAIGSEYIYSQCLTDNEKMAQIYESYGYVKQPKTKTIGKDGKLKVYMFHYPLKTDQTTLF